MIAIGSDHAGYGLKQIVMAHLKERGEEFKDYYYIAARLRVIIPIMQRR